MTSTRKERQDANASSWEELDRWFAPGAGIEILRGCQCERPSAEPRYLYRLVTLIVRTLRERDAGTQAARRASSAER